MVNISLNNVLGCKILDIMVFLFFYCRDGFYFRLVSWRRVGVSINIDCVFIIFIY